MQTLITRWIVAPHVRQQLLLQDMHMVNFRYSLGEPAPPRWAGANRRSLDIRCRMCTLVAATVRSVAFPLQVVVGEADVRPEAWRQILCRDPALHSAYRRLNLLYASPGSAGVTVPAKRMPACWPQPSFSIASARTLHRSASCQTHQAHEPRVPQNTVTCRRRPPFPACSSLARGRVLSRV